MLIRMMRSCVPGGVVGIIMSGGGGYRRLCCVHQAASPPPPPAAGRPTTLTMWLGRVAMVRQLSSSSSIHSWALGRAETLHQVLKGLVIRVLGQEEGP